MILNELLDSNVSIINLGNLPVHEGFAVGDIVDVASRMGPGFNKPGGAATVLSKTKKSGETVYSVNYTVGGGVEKDLPASLLSAHTEPAGRRSSMSSSSVGAAASSDARRVMDLEKELERMKNIFEKQTSAERWQALQDRQQTVVLRENLKGQAKELGGAMKAATDAVAKLKITQQLEQEQMHRNVEEITAVAEAAGEMSTEMASQLKALQSRVRKEEKRRKDAESAAEAARKKADADTARILANVHHLLDETKQAAEEEHEEALQDQALQVTELKERLEDSEKPASSLVGMAYKLGVQTEKRLTVATGATASSFENMGPRDQAAITRAAVSSIKKTLELASPISDAADSAPHIFKHVQLRGLVTAAVNSAVKNPELLWLRKLYQNVAVAVRIYAERKEPDNVQQLLSLFPRSFYPAGVIAAACSSPPKPFLPADLVRVESTRRYHGAAVLFARFVTAMENEKAKVVFLERSNAEKRQRFSTTTQAITAVAATAKSARAATVLDGEEEEEGEEVELSLLRHALAVRITRLLVYKAWGLATSEFPGAHPTKAGRLTRITKTLEGAQELAKHLGNEEYFALAEASRRNAERGLKFLRTMSRRRSYELLKTQCRLVCVPVIRWQEYLTMLSSRAYANLTLLNCVCTLCRVLIYEAKDEFLSLLRLVLAPTAKAKALELRIERHSRYLIFAKGREQTWAISLVPFFNAPPPPPSHQVPRRGVP